MQDGPGEEEEEERELPEGVAAAAGRADAIMENLAEMLAADGPDLDVLDLEDALRSADGELASLEPCLDPTPWLLPALDCYRGVVRRELWERLGDRADLDAACELLLSGVLGTPEPDQDDVFSLLQALTDRLQESPSASDRDTYIGWGSWLFSRPDVTGQPDGQSADQPDGPPELELLLREQLALQLLDRVESGDGDRAADLEAVIAHYEVLVAASPPGEPERAELLGMLVLACWDRVDGDASRQAEVDRLVRHAREARTAPGLPADVHGLIGLYLGIGLTEQFRLPGWIIDRGDVDLAVRSLSEVGPDVRAEPHVGAMVDTSLGLLLVGRGQMFGSAADLAAAEPFLVRAAGALEPDNPDLSEVMYNLAVAECVLANLGLDLTHSDQAVRLLRAAGERPSAEPERAAMIHLGLGALLLGRATGERSPAADEGIGHLTIAFQLVPVGSPTRLMAAWNLGSALATRFYTTGNRQDLQAAQFYLQIVDEARSAAASDGVADPLAAPDEMFADIDLLSAALRAQIAMARGLDQDPAGLDEAVEGLRTAVGLAGPGHPWTGRLRSDLGLALTARFDYGRRDPADLAQGATELEAAADLIPAGHLMRHMALTRAALARWLLARGSRDQRQMRDAIARMIELRAAAAGGRPGDPTRLTAMLALMHGDLYPVTGAAADLAAARDWFAQAAAEFERQPGHPNHGQLLIALARLERSIGDNQTAVRSGLAALRIRARDALLQTGPAHGLATARIAAAEAAEIAGWCLADGATGVAVEALELGRGLVLHAATSAADMPELLERAGRRDLADEWRRRAGEDAHDQPWDAADGPHDTVRHLLEGESLAVPSDLRERALNALDADVLVAPPDHREIAAALTRTGADALVYLLPATGDAPGRALIVRADGGRPREVPLPALRTSVALDQYETAQARMLTVSHTTADENEWGRQLGLLCQWAWTSVVRPLLAELAPSTAGAASPAGGPPRLVLVPMRRLGLVPWHAARRADRANATGWRYAITDAVLSYAASGRQLAEVSRRPALPLAGDPVIVAPLNDLQLMHREASALRERYPNARYLGFSLDGPVDGLATPDAVLGVLPARDRAGASLLHLVCHGVATSAGADASYLVLEDEQALTVKAILRQAHGRPAGAPGGLVDLVACRTDVTPADYDEALTLATAFLAAGAVTVLGSGWKIPESSSAVLMFMFHHFLAVEACPPRDALRRAQLWMADPGRVPPASMPAGLRKALAGNGPRALDDVLAWAGLTHQGQ